jgi:hypothetical protein
VSAESIIATLADRGSFSARRLSFHFPAEVMGYLSPGPRAFFRLRPLHNPEDCDSFEETGLKGAQMRRDLGQMSFDRSTGGAERVVR